jgi:hypothetical protein
MSLIKMFKTPLFDYMYNALNLLAHRATANIQIKIYCLADRLNHFVRSA